MIKSLKSKRGFTLIELIVVIAVIGILVLLAAPKFLGHTKNAHVAGMKADIKTLENAALTYYVDKDVDPNSNGEWPAGEPVELEGELKDLLDGVEVKELSDDIEYQSLKNELKDYVIVTDGDLEGQVFYTKGAEDKDGNIHYGLTKKVDADNEDNEG